MNMTDTQSEDRREFEEWARKFDEIDLRMERFSPLSGLEYADKNTFDMYSAWQAARSRQQQYAPAYRKVGTVITQKGGVVFHTVSACGVKSATSEDHLTPMLFEQLPSGTLLYALVDAAREGDKL